MTITFNTEISITAGQTSFADLFADDSEEPTYYRLWAGNIENGHVEYGGVVSTPLGGGWVARDNISSLPVTEEESGYNTLYVQAYSPGAGQLGWTHAGGFDFPEERSLAMDFDTSSPLESETPLDSLFSFTPPSRVDNDEIWFQFRVDGEYLDTSLGSGWVCGSRISEAVFPAVDGEVTILPFYNGSKQSPEKGAYTLPKSGTVFELTEGVDAGEAYTGTDGNDEFIATDKTLNSGDDLDGAAGTDLLLLTSNDETGNPVSISGFSTENIENMQVTANSAGGTTLDLSGAQGISKLTNYNSSSPLKFSNIQALAEIELKSVAAEDRNNHTTTLEYKDSVVSGNDDTQKLVLNYDPEIAYEKMGKLTVNGIETFEIATKGDPCQLIDLASDSLKGLKISGKEDLRFDIRYNSLDFAEDAVIEASNFSGDLQLGVNSADVDVVTTSGSGNDTICYAHSFDSGDELNGGAGTDEILMHSSVAVGGPQGKLSNVEKLGLGTAGSGMIDMDYFPGITEVKYYGGIDGDTTAGVKNAESGLTVRVDLDGDYTTSESDLDIWLGSDGDSDEVTVFFNRIGESDQIGAVIEGMAETLNLEIEAAADKGELTIGDLDLKVAQELNIQGDSDLCIAKSTQADPSALAAINATEASGGLNISGINTASVGAVIALGSGSDVFNVAASPGADTFTLGDGEDKIVYSSFSNSRAGNADTITDFVRGKDTIDLAELGTVDSSYWLGNAADNAAAEAEMSGTAGEAVFVQSEKKLVVDEGSGAIDENDLQVQLNHIDSLTAYDLGLWG